MKTVSIFCALACAPLCLAQRPTVDDAKQALTRGWQRLTPSGFTERNVLFQDVRPGNSGGASFPFEVTVLIRDYEPGYPPNHYYGRTCVSKIDEEVYTLERDQFNGWNVQGRMTPPMQNVRCEKNPSAGVSAIPLASLSGTQAGPGSPAAPPAAPPSAPAPAAGDRGIALGPYECWGNGQAHLTMNFTIQPGNKYVGYNGQTGTYSMDASNHVTFKGGPLDGVMPKGFIAVYHIPNHPTVSFQSPRGAEAAFCERK